MSSIYKNPMLMGRAVVNVNSESNGIGYIVATLYDDKFVVEYDHDIVGDKFNDVVEIINRNMYAKYPLIDCNPIFVAGKRKRSYDIVLQKNIELLYEDDELKYIPLSKEEMLRETISNFNSLNRSVDDKLKYQSGCVIGRYLDDDTCKILDGLSHTRVGDVFNMLPSGLKVHGVRFLSMVQVLHDNHDNWLTTGLSTHGVDWVKRIINEFDLDYDKVFLIC